MTEPALDRVFQAHGIHPSEPERAVVPPPPNAHHIAPSDATPRETDLPTHAQQKQDRKRLQLVKGQPEPSINTKAAESTHWTVETNSTAGDVGRGHVFPDESVLGDEDDEEGRISQHDSSSDSNLTDPEGIYRSAPSTPLEEFNGSVRLTKEERKVERKEAKARRRQKLVKDPVTGRDIWIEHVRGSTKRIMANESIVKPMYSKMAASDEAKTASVLSMLSKVPLKDPTNVLFYPMQPPEWRELMEESQRALFQWGNVVVFLSLTLQVVFSTKFLPIGWLLWIHAILAIGSLIWVRNNVTSHFRETFHEAERVRGENATLSQVPESVEWLNNIVRTIWPTINPELFAGPVDLLEDVMQKQVPSIVHTVKVSDLDIGSVPLRILSMRYLPDDGHARDEDDAGEYANIEVSFGYRGGKTDKSLSTKAKHIHLLVWFQVGLRKVLGIPIPIWVEVQGIVGKARVRVQLLPDPPFVKNGTLTLLGMPKIELSTTPVSQRFFNVMNLPFVSQLVSFAIKIVARDLIAPRSYTLDISKLMVGDDVKKETAAIGVLMVTFHHATGVPRSDHRPGRAKVDPYLTLQYSQFGKTTYSTRVIKQDHEPVWEETCFLPILPGPVKAGEKIRVNLWDSDRFTADDLLGRVELDLATLVRQAGHFERRNDKIVGTRTANLHWSIGFFGKRTIPDQPVPPLVDTRTPPDLRDHPDFKEKQPAWTVDSKQEQLICRLPPDMRYPGVLSIQIHQINDLGIPSVKSSFHHQSGDVIAEEAVEVATEDDSKSAPSSYCCISLNDELVYKTRTRAFTNRPIFNASFERFIRCCTDTRIRITVRDQRFREDDPIIGILPLDLGEVLKDQGQVTRWFPIAEGLGYGIMRVSILFRNIDLQLPRALQGWNLGTLKLYSFKAVVGEEDAAALQDCSLRIDTQLQRKTISAIHAGRDGDVSWDMPRKLIFPIRRRHATSMSIEMHRGGVPFTKKGLFSGIYGSCCIALSAIEDNQRSILKIPIFQTADYARFKKNSLSESDASLRKIGYLEVDCCLISGLSPVHRRFCKRSSDLAQTHEAWETEQSFKKRMHDDLRMEKGTNEERLSTAETFGVSIASMDTPRTGPNKALEAPPDEDWMDSDSDADKGHRTVSEWVEDKAAARRERHRRHRGIMQKKPIRTAAWVKNGLKKGVSKVSRALTLNREDDLVEREV